MGARERARACEMKNINLRYHFISILFKTSRSSGHISKPLYIMSASRLASTAIKIPKRIERGPTDILKALASTVKHVPKEPDQLLQDDPFLLPVRPIDRNFYAMSRLSGKATAKFILNKRPEMFYRDDSEPKVRSFLPPEEFREDMVFDEGDLKWCIDNNDPINAIIAYQTLDKAGVQFGRETLLDLFEMICYSNEEKLNDLLSLRQDYFSSNSESQLVKHTWNKNGLASKIFNQLKEDPEAPRIYSTMIAGLSKYNEHVTANQIFEDFREFHPDKGLYACAYDGLIRSIPNLCSSLETAQEALLNVVKHMEQHLVKPDLLVFNSILSVYNRFTVDDAKIREALKLINDMRALGIEPSLFSYQCIFSLIGKSRSRGSYLNMIGGVLDYIHFDDDLMTVKDSRDTQFLQQAMRTVVYQLNSLPLAKKVHRIYMKIPNMFEFNSRKQGYLDTYFRLIVTTMSMDEIWKFYTTYVPSNFRPSAETYDALVETLDLYQADGSIIKRVGSDIVEFRMAEKIKDDTIFKKDPDYIEKLSQSRMDKRERTARQNELLKDD